MCQHPDYVMIPINCQSYSNSKSRPSPCVICCMNNAPRNQEESIT